MSGHDHDHDHPHDHDGHHHGHGHGHEHGHGHHHHAPADFGRAFAIGLALNLAYVVVEAFWGIAAHSMALLADAGHNLGDVAGLGGAWLATWLGRRGPSAQYTYGLRRASILSALANAVILLVATGGIAWEAILRLIRPEPSGGIAIMAVAAAGIVVNGGTALMFASGRKGDLNVRAAFTHMVADASLTLAVLIAGGVILATGWQRLDPAVSLIVGVAIVAGTWSLLRDSVNLSLDAVPPGIEQGEVAAYLRGLPGVREVHDLHVWGLSTTESALTVHLVRDGAEGDDDLLRRIPHEVRERFGIGHATIQLESPQAAHTCHLRPADVV